MEETETNQKKRMKEEAIIFAEFIDFNVILSMWICKPMFCNLNLHKKLAQSQLHGQRGASFEIEISSTCTCIGMNIEHLQSSYAEKRT